MKVFLLGEFNYGWKLIHSYVPLIMNTTVRCNSVERRIKIDQLNDDGNQLKAVFARITKPCPERRYNGMCARESMKKR